MIVLEFENKSYGTQVFTSDGLEIRYLRINLIRAVSYISCLPAPLRPEAMSKL